MSLLIGNFYRFGAFTLDTEQRILLREGKPLALAPKVFDTLFVLVESTGRIVAKEELMNRLWPDTYVEESNLTFNIQQLRKILGDNARQPVYIETVARRGYRFIARVEEELGKERATAAQTSDPDSGEVPLDAHELIPVARPAGENQQITTDSILTAIPGSKKSTHLAKRAFLIAVALIILLAGTLFIVWKRSKDISSNEKLADRKSSLTSSLKLEKLTQTGQSRFVAISPDGKYIAYSRSIELKTSIWLRQLATNTNVEIVPSTGLMFGLAFTNGGEYLYFAKGSPTALYRVSPLGGVPTKILDNVDGNFSFSSDDQQIAFIRRVVRSDGQNEDSLTVAAADGRTQHTLLTRTAPDRLTSPLWSPDNQSIICVYGGAETGSRTVGIVGINVADGGIRELSPDRFSTIGRMAWLPDRSGLIMAARKDAPDNKELWQASFPDMKITRITEGLSPYLDLSIAANMDLAAASQATRISDIWVGSSAEPRSLRKITQATDEFSWTPNGRLVYQSTASGNSDLWITLPDGADQKQLTNGPAVEGNPAVTPDNRYIVFTSNRTGIRQLWRMNIDGSNQIQLTDGAAKDYSAISPDGKWVVCNTTDDWNLWKVSIEGGEATRLTDYPAAFPAISPDGRIACVGRREPKREYSILILPFEGSQPLKKMNFTGAGFSKYRMVWTSDGKALIYGAELTSRTVLFRQPLDGSVAREIMDFHDDELFDFGYSFDGRFLAVTRGGWQHDIVLITDFKKR